MTAVSFGTPFTVPGPPLTPLIGRRVAMVRLFNDPIRYLGQLFRRYGPVVAITAGGGTRLFSSAPDCG